MHPFFRLNQSVWYACSSYLQHLLLSVLLQQIVKGCVIYWLILWTRIFLEKPVSTHLVESFLSFMEPECSWYHVHKSLPLASILSHKNLIHILTLCSFKILFNILPFMPVSHMWSSPFRLSDCVCNTKL